MGTVTNLYSNVLFFGVCSKTSLLNNSMKIPWNFTNNILTITLLRRTTNFIKTQNDRGSVRNIFAVSLLVFSVFAIVAFAYPSKLLLAQNAPTPTPQQTAFVNSFQKLVGDANNLTRSYQSEVTKWKRSST